MSKWRGKPESWAGDLNDDCILRRYGYIAHVEKMDEGHWWFAIGLDNPNPPPVFWDIYNSADMNTQINLKTGEQARLAAEHCLELIAQHGLKREPSK